MTFDDDYMVFPMLSGPPKYVTLKSQGLEWPPPLHVHYLEFPFRRVRLSEITDEQRKVIHFARGAVYESLSPGRVR